MTNQGPFATWAADWSLFGYPVWHSLAVGMVAAFLISRFSPLSIELRRRLLVWLPGLMLLNCFFTRWINTRSASFPGNAYFYKFYYASLDSAFIVSFAFGVGFTVDALRASERRCRIIGWSFAPIYVGLFAGVLWYLQGAFHWLEV